MGLQGTYKLLHTIKKEKCPRGTPRSRREQQVGKNVTEKGGRLTASENGGGEQKIWEDKR
jgi:hypothetical protein